ncbi:MULTISPECIES: BamA/TamA family outer membrane protein [unclassified Coleofasciculus]|uniref:BamA/TamA family outer membrane protein n=1 Tax=unclassified Coleofasciculus TaxID=2692782 RepID=UPI00187F0DA8|nr:MULTISPECIES: BamA/TamA family outer membrane protein [unclassified Coleofasciculus]MBE9125180.1 BamA/TamA family outer membrane protein [Coleofasciculus sp. LEGE 07081]MBE9148757.1 BamA/TamA family outer membrane protein [Coleofasciculus sp. LEGE 07092]
MQKPGDLGKPIASSLLLSLATTSISLLVATPSWTQTSCEAYSINRSTPQTQTPPISAFLPWPEPRFHPVAQQSLNPADRACVDPASPLAQRNPFEEEETLSFYIGSKLPNPTASQGPTSAPITPAASDLRGGTNITVGSQLNLGDTQRLALELKGGESVLGLYLGYVQVTDDPRQGFAVSGFNQRSYSTALAEGDRNVELPGGDTPWVHRLGGGVEGYIPIGTVDTTVGVTYQRVSVRDDVFTSDLAPVDELGNPLTISDDGQDELLTLNLAAQYDTRNSPRNPSEGTRIRLGLDQSIPVGDAEISMTRVNASATQFIPLSLFGFAEGSRTLVLNLQGGHIFGDAPFYEAFSLGGASSVRGYSGGEIGTGQSYIQATAEYRFPITSLTAFDEAIDLGGSLFIDYGNVLDTQDEVFGKPGLMRDKPGEGWGFGLGLRAYTSFTTGQAEFAISEQGDVEFHFSLGQRF